MKFSVQVGHGITFVIFCFGELVGEQGHFFYVLGILLVGVYFLLELVVLEQLLKFKSMSPEEVGEDFNLG